MWGKWILRPKIVSWWSAVGKHYTYMNDTGAVEGRVGLVDTSASALTSPISLFRNHFWGYFGHHF